VIKSAESSNLVGVFSSDVLDLSMASDTCGDARRYLTPELLS
jgi:hypothetical protein